VLPSVKRVVDYFSNRPSSTTIDLRWNDFSNMNAGPFPTHDNHRQGNNIDGTFTDYAKLDATTAQTILALLTPAAGASEKEQEEHVAHRDVGRLS